MYSKIMVPVDLAHVDHLTRALDTAESFAQVHGSDIVYVSITAQTPTQIAHNPAEFSEKLQEFAKSRPGGKGQSHAIAAHDPSIDIDKLLLKAIADTGADLVVMASHKPGIADYFWGSHGGSLAAHATVSVFVVR